ncbi:SdiA-regulated domain-containing protein [Variovorax sp. ZS18.2.2]
MRTTTRNHRAASRRFRSPLDSDGKLYLLSEPNLFYRFERAPAATPSPK